MAAWAGTIHVLRRPNVLTYSESTKGAHSSLNANGKATVEKTACCMVDTFRSTMSNGKLPPNPIGMPCSV